MTLFDDVAVAAVCAAYVICNTPQGRSAITSWRKRQEADAKSQREVLQAQHEVEVIEARAIAAAKPRAIERQEELAELQHQQMVVMETAKLESFQKNRDLMHRAYERKQQACDYTPLPPPSAQNAASAYRAVPAVEPTDGPAAMSERISSECYVDEKGYLRADNGGIVRSTQPFQHGGLWFEANGKRMGT